MGISRRTALTVVGLTTAVLCLGIAGPAEAVWVPPSPAQLVNAGGTANGCTVSIRVTKSVLAGSEDLGVGVLVESVEYCPAGADVHRLVTGLTEQEVDADGSLTALLSGGGGMLQSSGDPIVGTSSTGMFQPCSTPSLKGTHTYRAVARVVAKVQPSWRDPDPFIGKAGATATITC
jgi:hypothetical protein